MKFLALSFPILLFPALTNAATTTVSFDSVYDDPNLPTTSVACSDGTNGLLTKGYPNLGSVPGFPYVGAAFTVPGWNSPNCGKRYWLEYNGWRITMVAVDHAEAGFVLSKTALDALTGGQAGQLGRITADWGEI
ncbi:hypothetical protein RUND412_001521 [Rhizina undulata]